MDIKPLLICRRPAPKACLKLPEHPLCRLRLGPGVVALLYFCQAGLVVLDASAASVPAAPDTLLSLSIEDLATVEITSVSKRPEALSDAAAAVFVISNDDIRRSGATSIPEALRLAPNIEVARIDSTTYAISARGFNGNTSNKLLVLIDGRTVYTPLYSGVFWDAQSVPLADVERIEVINGPGGTLWGANAVNGVINIITKSSKDTQGMQADLGGGNTERDGTVRYGGSLGANTSYRVYALGLKQDALDDQQNLNVDNAWNKQQAGFRTDWQGAGNALTVQGDTYYGVGDEYGLPPTSIGGSNLLGRWSSNLANGSDLQVQTYFDQAKYEYPDQFNTVLDTYDLSLQQHYAAGSNDLVWGGGYRTAQDQVTNTPTVAFLPANQNTTQGNIFAQDTIALTKSLQLTLGAKLEHNNYTGYENEPNVRLGWKLDDHSLLWSAISKAVRTPSQLEEDYYVYVPSIPLTELAGNPNWQSEELTAYEIGYRSQPGNTLSYSISTFYNDYSRLRSYSNPPFPLIPVNNMFGHTSGVEMWADYQALSWWRLSPGYSYLREYLFYEPGETDLLGFSQAGDDPEHQFSLRSAMNLPHDIEFDLNLRSIAQLPYEGAPGYSELNARLGWQINKHVEVSLNGDNLLHPRHVEFINSGVAQEIDRSYFLATRLTY